MQASRMGQIYVLQQSQKTQWPHRKVRGTANLLGNFAIIDWLVSILNCVRFLTISFQLSPN